MDVLADLRRLDKEEKEFAEDEYNCEFTNNEVRWEREAKKKEKKKKSLKGKKQKILSTDLIEEIEARR